ncbi:uncharacterized protein MKK02DRAFT_22987 [Dioszegia hungarica]|uniref:Tetratricopeptide repeat protein 39B n=1 Tax=Dioszegia hungarica TaxID=4972 RepID=A0AA38LWJ4_9TREE|nr:uncharacterized protein MKK02DRAFT_22987 [Dioszegia hungarica]KAI9638385.1 hypothetical protein MKK02DRAFT_22987 [Dioszegia hungarica]
MREAEEVCIEKDPEGNHLYLQVAYCIFQALKGMMTFDANDLSTALEISKNVQVMATALRKPSDGLMSRFGSLVKSGAGVQRLKGMSVMERHAELVYAESSLFKALLAIIAGGDWFGMIREALSMRAAWGIYRTMQTFIEEADAHGYDDDIDMDFRSGVALGAGTSSLMLSLLPGKVLKIAEVLGYGGDRDAALKVLYSAGGWSKDADVPIHDEHNEGLRRPVVDLILLTFHLVLALLMPIAGVDIPMARKILEYNMRIYPDEGIFFLYFQARLFTAECNPDKANESLQRAMDLKLEYVQLQHMCLWDYANNYTMSGNWKGALDCYNILREESNWSRAVYTYSTAACIVELVSDGYPGASLVEAEKLMKEVPKLTKKLAGKSLPIEKLVSRKTRKFESQGHRLFLPGIELAYVFGSLGHAPRRTLISSLIPRIDKRMADLQAQTPEAYGAGYWDDLVLGHFLRGVCKAMARYQPPQADELARAVQSTDPSDAELDAGAEEDMLAAIKNSPHVELDHYIVYHCHFELGKLYSQRGENKSAYKHFDVVMTGKLSELNKHEQKAQGKYSLEGALLMKTHSAIQALKEGNTAA